MGNPKSLKGYYIYTVFAILNGFGGSVWGGFTFYIGIPVIYLTYLKASSFEIGLITAIFWGALAIPQFWAAYISEKRSIKKYWIAFVIITSSFSWLILGMYILITGAENTRLSIWLFLVLYAWACLIKAFDVPANSAMVFKLIPTDKLGKLGGIVGSLQYIGIFAVGLVIIRINLAFEKPFNIGIMFLATFITSIVMTILLLTLDEPENETKNKSPHFAAFLGKCFIILKTDRIFTKFIIGKWLMSGHHIMMAFILAYLITERGLTPVTAGLFSSLHALGVILTGLTIARFTDIYGPKFMFMLSQLLVLVYIALTWLTPWTSTPLFISIFIITGVAMAADWSGLGYMMLQCCPTEDKSTYVALTFIGVNVLTVPFPMIFGKMMDMDILNHNRLFAILIATTVAALVYIITVFDNPSAFTRMKKAQVLERETAQVKV
ncbi:MFS transporter [Candidatus Latescibacterota bacterium]